MKLGGFKTGAIDSSPGRNSTRLLRVEAEEMSNDTKLPDCATLALRLEGCRLFVTLDRPRSRNALSFAAISELAAVFAAIHDTRQVRCVVMRGAGGIFCAGGDVRDMEAGSHQVTGEDDSLATANRAYGTLLTAIDHAPQAVVCIVEGIALGGGLGLVAVSDVALATDDCRFGMPEARLGLLPAQIAPFVVRRVGLTHARRLGLTGTTIDGRAAREIGLVHDSHADVEALEAAAEKTIRQVERCGPEALAATKELLHAVGTADQEALLDHAAREFARLGRSTEAREGLAAFMEKRVPSWAKNEP